MKTVPGIAAPRQNLRRLLVIRWLLLLCLLVGMLFAQHGFDLDLPYALITALLAVIAAFNLLTGWRLRKPWAVTPPEFFLQILLDIAGVTLLFYYTGGAANPFVFYYLVPLSISSATLPWRFTSALALLSVLCYTGLLFFHVNVPGLAPVAGHETAPSLLNAHILGMWFNFIVSAGLITFFVVRMSNALKQQEQQLNQWREESLRDEQVLAVATLAAGTAHELGSPLTTMKLLVNEMAHDYRENSRLSEDLGTLLEQVDLCSRTLRDLVRRAESDQASFERGEAIAAYCERVVERWRLLRPKVDARIEIQDEDATRRIHYHSTVEQALINLLNNAADAAREQVTVSFSWSAGQFRITIEDDGPGLPASIRENLGQPFISSKEGLGLGFFLSNATISRYGGEMEFRDRQTGGTRLAVHLPLEQHD